MIVICYALLSVGMAGIGAVFLLYPLVLWLRALGHPETAPPAPSDPPPSVSVVVVVRNGEGMIRQKIENTEDLQYPDELLEIVVCSDASDDGTDEILKQSAATRRNAVFLEQRAGKNEALNAAVARATGEIVVFTDVDARMEPDALSCLVRHFVDDKVGGVCGQRVIRERQHGLGSSQRRYISWDSRIKELESRRGSLTSNDGKLYAMRRSLFRTVASGVTDDLFNALTVVASGHRFLFDGSARAGIVVPSRSLRHEVRRRRRIVARSLRGIYLHRDVLNPFSYGSYAPGLFVNKILRRLLPVFLILIALASVGLASRSVIWLYLVAVQFAGYCSGALILVLPQVLRRRRIFRLLTLAAYTCSGLLGTLLGLRDFVLRKTVVIWDPEKAGVDVSGVAKGDQRG